MYIYSLLNEADKKFGKTLSYKNFVSEGYRLEGNPFFNISLLSFLIILIVCSKITVKDPNTMPSEHLVAILEAALKKELRLVHGVRAPYNIFLAQH